MTMSAPNTSKDALLVRLDGFEGPLDLLLQLARRQRVDLARISISMLIDQYLSVVLEADRTDIIQAADWLVMAAWLTWLKSRLLLSVDAEEARQADQAGQVLTKRLVELERARTVADWLNGQPQLGWDMFARGHLESPKTVAPVANYMMLMEACLNVLGLEEGRAEELYQPRRVIDWTPQQAMARIQSMLQDQPSGADLLAYVPTLPKGVPNRVSSLRIAISSTLVAGLEMARTARIHLHQASPFEPIRVELSGGDAPNIKVEKVSEKINN
jgi:segregation and condensation protein A